MVSHAQVMNMLRRNAEYNDMVGSTNGAGYIGGSPIGGRKPRKSKKMSGRGYIGGCANCMDGGCVHCMNMRSGYMGGAKVTKGVRHCAKYATGPKGSGYIGGLFSPNARAKLSNYREWMAEHKHIYPDFKHRLMVYHQQHPKDAKGGAVRRKKAVKHAKGGYAKGFKKSLNSLSKQQLIDEILASKHKIGVCGNNNKNLRKISYPKLSQYNNLYKDDVEYIDLVEKEQRKDPRFNLIEI